MSDEDFLKRWSRRKQAAEGSPESVSQASKPKLPIKDDATPVAEPELISDEEFDLSALPPLDTITEATDVAAFLRKGVPAALTREALRRAWLADPAIRDFVGLAENAWDFNDSNAMMGFEPLDYTAEQMRELVAKIVGGTPDAADEADATSQPEQDSVITRDADNACPAAEPGRAITEAAEAIEHAPGRAEQSETGSATAPESSSPAIHDSKPDAFSIVRRTHGSALPR